MKPTILGIDPGLHGALAFVQLIGGTPRVEVFDMPIVAKQVNNISRSRIDKPALADLIASRIHTLRCVVIEDVHALPKDGPVQAFTFGYGLGLLHGICQVYDLSVVNVPPHSWKSKYGLTSDKHKSRAVASRFFPHNASAWSRAKDDGRAEAALLGLLGFTEGWGA
jgi:crossover junction endodeoxyribonuclease RuvC